MKVYVLWHVYKLSDDIGEHDEEKLVGIYSTEKKARDAIQNHKDLEGFKEAGEKIDLIDTNYEQTLEKSLMNFSKFY